MLRLTGGSMQRPALRTLAFAAGLLLSPAASGSGAAEETPVAQRLFSRYAGVVAEVRIVEATSGAKRSLGTGFLVSERGDIATNYHVISELVVEPERYRAELVHEDGKTVALELLDFDVVNDLAILRGDTAAGEPLRLHTGPLQKGQKVFALGNPYDLGMSIVEGTYNGRLQHSRTDRIHFSGALNPGMSGGPALLGSGELIGVNVATAGNSVSFLVPAERLKELLARVEKPGFAPESDLRAELRDQLWVHQERYLGDLFLRDPEEVALGSFRVPTMPASWFHCVGDVSHEEEDLHEELVHQCGSDDYVFISEEHEFAPLWFRHRRLQSDELRTPAFYELYSDLFEETMSRLSGNERVATPFRCVTRFVDNGSLTFKTAFCARAYRKLEGLYDVVFKAAALGTGKQGLETALVLSAVSWENAQRVSRHYFEAIRWSE
jgi:hypothetical protein